MARNAARNCRVAARGHGLRVVRGLLGGRKFSGEYVLLVDVEESFDFCVWGSHMVRRSVLAMFAVVAIVLGFVVVSTPACASHPPFANEQVPRYGRRYRRRALSPMTLRRADAGSEFTATAA
jgi:hypothetical protein